MEVSVWTNSRRGAANATFGLRVSKLDREKFFPMATPTVSIDVAGLVIKKKLPKSFWLDCIEIRHSAITDFLRRNQFTSWPLGKPPILILQPVSEGHFRLLTKEGC